MTQVYLTLSDLLSATDGHLVGSTRPDLPINSVCVDSRTVRPGGLFIALRGRERDGHSRVQAALAAGAVAALVEETPDSEMLAEDGVRPSLVRVRDTLEALTAFAHYWRSRQQLTVAVLVGSVGRGPTAELSMAVLSQRYETAIAAVDEDPEVEVPLALLNLTSSARRLVLGVALSEAADVARIVGLARPRDLVVTNLEPTRLISSGSLDRLASRISQLAASIDSQGTVVLNADDGRVRALGALTRAAPVLYGLDSQADVRAESVVSHGLDGIEFDLVVARRSVHVRLPVLGLNSIHSALAAAALGLAAGLELREIGVGLQTASPTLRVIVAIGLNGSRVIDDSYNANPESALEALNLLAELDGRKVAVLGDMLGIEDFEEAGHRKVGNRAAIVVQQLVTVGERARLIADEARSMGLGNIHEAATNDEAVEVLKRELRAGDTVLIKGSRELQIDDIVRAIRLEG